MLSFRTPSSDDLAIKYETAVIETSGRLSTKVPLVLSSSNQVTAPALSLVHNGSARPSIIGAGWSVSGAASFSVDTSRGLPSYRNGIHTPMTGPNGEELVPSYEDESQASIEQRQSGDYSVTTFRARTETYARYERWTSSTGRVHWRYLDGEGSVSIFGLAADDSSRVFDPSEPKHVYRWLVDVRIHVDGRAVRYLYKKEDGTGIFFDEAGDGYPVEDVPAYERSRRASSFAKRYLKRVRYGNRTPLLVTSPFAHDAADNWAFEVCFDYGDHADTAAPGLPESTETSWEDAVRSIPFSRYAAGFEVRTWRTCRRIMMIHRLDELSDGPQLEPKIVHSLELNRGELQPPPASHSEQLVSLKRHHFRYNDDGEIDTRSTTDLEFEYGDAEVAAQFQTPHPSAVRNVPGGTPYRWIDLHGEGLPGILFRHRNSWKFKRNLGNGRFGSVQDIPELPNAIARGFDLADHDGNGTADLGSYGSSISGHYRRDSYQHDWKGFESFRAVTKPNVTDARQSLVDFNGDGLPDLLVDHGSYAEWFPSTGAYEFGDPEIVPRPEGAPPLVPSPEHDSYYADMTGDGLPDLVRLRRNCVQYWPNLGQGRFGNKVTMSNAPSPASDAFDQHQRRVFADVNGSGASDLIFVEGRRIQIFENLGGNRFADPTHLSGIPSHDDFARVEIVDYLANGAPCLVWSSPLTSSNGHQLKYLPLQVDPQPGRLESVSNGIGRTTTISYRAATLDYVRDLKRNRQWFRKVPSLPVVVSELVDEDSVSAVGRYRRYTYHDAGYDERRRRFAGFGNVETTDLPTSSSGSSDPDALEQTTGALRRQWFLTGDSKEFSHLSEQFFRDETDRRELTAPTLVDRGTLSQLELLDGYRQFRGQLLREEVYSLGDDVGSTSTPKQIRQSHFTATRLQSNVRVDQCVFDVIGDEELESILEATPDDPRTSHTLILGRDDLGNITSSLEVSYPRHSTPGRLDAQSDPLATWTSQAFLTNSEDDRYETSIPLTAEQYELLGLPTFDADETLALEDAQSLVDNASSSIIDLTDTPSSTPSATTISKTEYIYADPSTGDALQAGTVGQPTLLHHQRQAVLPEGIETDWYGDRIDTTDLSDAGYTLLDGYWHTSEPAYAYNGTSKFYTVSEQRSGYDSSTDAYEFSEAYTYDVDVLYVTETTNAAGHTRSVDVDAHWMSARKQTDPNGNVVEVRYDPLGVPVQETEYGAQWVDGSAINMGFDPLDSLTIPETESIADLIGDPATYLGRAKRRTQLSVDSATNLPVITTLTRERNVHRDDGASYDGGPFQIEITYFDGLGRQLQRKQKVDAGDVIERDTDGSLVLDVDGLPALTSSTERWWVSGFEHFNARGESLATHEPFFSADHEFEGDPELRELGVATRRFYDAQGRVTEQRHPDGTRTTRTYGTWQRKEYDRNDTLPAPPDGGSFDHVDGLSFSEFLDRLGLDASEYQSVYDRSADTPTTHALDSRGRVVQRTYEGGASSSTITETRAYDRQGNIQRETDGRGIDAVVHTWDMLGGLVKEVSADAGTSYTFYNARRLDIASWDARDVQTSKTFDTLGRPTATRYSDANATDRLEESYTYDAYDTPPSSGTPAERNVIGQLTRQRDDAGELTLWSYDRTGGRRVFARTFRQTWDTSVDWDGSPTLESTAHETTYRYDALGRRVTEETADGLTRSYDYGPRGHVAEVTAEADDGTLSSTTIATAMSYSALGERAAITFGNDVRGHYNWNRRTRRLDGYEVTKTDDTRAYADVRYRYDPAGNITRWIDAMQEPSASGGIFQGSVTSERLYTYDAHDRLTSASGRYHQALLPNTGGPQTGVFTPDSLNNFAAFDRYSRSYTYDDGGNLTRIQHTNDDGTPSGWTIDKWVSANSNRQADKYDDNGVEIPNPDQQFNAAGARTSFSHLADISYTARGRLAEAVVIERSGGDPNDAEYYVYDAEGRRVRRVTKTLVDAANGTTEIVDVRYLDGCEYRSVRQGSTTSLARWTSQISAGEETLATVHRWEVDTQAAETDDISTARIHYLVGDHLGSVSFELDESAQVISYEEYLAYGGTAFVLGDAAREVGLRERRYSGKLRDGTTGFYVYAYRYYLPWIGNWLSPDPAGDVDGLNRFAFVGGNPVRFVDELGLCGVDTQQSERFDRQDLNPFTYEEGSDTIGIEIPLGPREQPETSPGPDDDLVPEPAPDYDSDGEASGDQETDGATPPENDDSSTPVDGAPNSERESGDATGADLEAREEPADPSTSEDATGTRPRDNSTSSEDGTRQRPMISPDDEPASPLREEAPPSPDSDTPSRPDGRHGATPGGEHSDPGASEPQERRGQIRGDARRRGSDGNNTNSWWDRLTGKFSQFWDRGGRELIGGTVVLGVAVATIMSGGTALGAFAAFEAGMAAAGGFSMATLGATELAVNDPSMDQQFDEASEALTNYVDPLQQGTATVGAVATGTEEGAEQGARLGEAINTARFLYGVTRMFRQPLRIDEAGPPRQSTSLSNFDGFNPSERAIAEYLDSLGHVVRKNPMEGAEGAGRQADAIVDGVLVEFKSLEAGADSKTILNRVDDALYGDGQARTVVLDVRGTGMSEAEANRGIARAIGANQGKVDYIAIIGDTFFTGFGP